MGDYVCTRFLHRLFPCVPAAQPNLANSAPAPLLDTILDLDRNSHDPWIPLLGRNGLVNRSLLGIGVVDGPQEWLLYSEFAVILGYVHLYTLMMIVPIFNSMTRIDRSLIEAASDAGASTLQVLWTVILPLSKTGIAIGSIFVIAMVMGDFVTVDVFGGGQVASVGKQIATQLSYLQFPPAAANAMILLLAVIAMIALLVRVVDIRKEL